MTVQVTRRVFTVDEYQKMIQAGILAKDDRVELIKGEIVEMSPISSRHAACVDRLNHFFVRRLGERAIVRVQNPLRLDEYSEPEPDLALVEPRPDFYATAHPGPEDVLLIIEVAETSLPFDREVKLPLYAQSEVPEVWLVNLVDGSIEIYRQPSAWGYKRVDYVLPGESLSPQAFPSLELLVDTLLG